MGKGSPTQPPPPQPPQPAPYWWQKTHETYLHSDKLAADLGVFCLKILMTVNAGGIVALIALVANLNKRQDHDMRGAALTASEWFLYGLFSAMLSAGIAYFYQTLVTSLRVHELDKLSGAAKPRYATARILAKCLWWPMVIAAAAAFGLFICGSVKFLGGVS